MNRLMRGTRLLLPGFGWMGAYWAMTVVLLTLVSLGLEATGPYSGSLWGLPLQGGIGGFGVKVDQILQNAYLEMMRHIWMIVLLPFVCFVGTKPLARSFHSDFEEFLSYSRSPRLFIEAARFLALGALVVGLFLPFVAGALWGMVLPGLDWTRALDGMASCGACLLFVSILVYLFASIGFPPEISSSLGLVAPFFLTGLIELLDKGGLDVVRDLLPPGLPVSADIYSNPNLKVGVLFTLVAVSIRLLIAGRTRWLVTNHVSCQQR